MLRNLIVFGLLIGLTGCAAAKNQPALQESQETPTVVKVDVDEEQIAEAETAVKEKLKDPESAVFKDIHGTSITENGPLMGICGQVNAKNSYGGFTGFSPFAYSQGEAYVWRRSERLSADNSIIKMACGL